MHRTYLSLVHTDTEVTISHCHSAMHKHLAEKHTVLQTFMMWIMVGWCRRCVLAYPETSRPFLTELFELWVAHLWDNIPSVRDNSATALGNAIRAYGAEVLDKLVPLVR